MTPSIGSGWKLGGVLAGYLIDRQWGEPPDRFHPMVYLGRVLEHQEERWYADSRPRGALFVVASLGSIATITPLLRRLLGRRLALTVVVAVASASKMLNDEAQAIGDLLAAGHIKAARRRIPSLVGRNSDYLDEAGLTRAVVESLAENTVDAVTATLIWGQLLGPGAVAVHRAANTLDAMIGHPNDRYLHFGWAAAKLDDALNWLPARLTAAAVAVAGPRPALEVAKVIVRDGRDHPSPNGGLVEAAYAASLGVTLGGTNTYGSTVEHRGLLGDGPPPQAAHIAEAVRLSKRTSLLVAVAPVAVAMGSKACALVWAMRQPSPIG